MCRSFFSWSTSDFLPFPLHKRKQERCCNIPLEALEDDWIFLYWWSGKDTHSVVAVVDAPGFNLLLLSSAWKEKEKKENHFWLLFLPVNRKEKWKFSRLHFCCCCCLLFFWKRTVDRSTDSKAPGGGGMGVAPYASVYMYSRRSIATAPRSPWAPPTWSQNVIFRWVFCVFFSLFKKETN